MLPPATPTAGREYFAQFQIRRPHITPINGFVSVDLDESLTSRFNKVELIGTGEFSQVYRVTQSQNYFQITSKVSGTEGSPQTSLPEFLQLRSQEVPIVGQEIDCESFKKWLF
jgi:mitosis inhibitor protein kinase SWE1